MDIGHAEVEELDLVIVGAGICGLATALALHRNGIRSVVLERSETLRTSGVAFGISSNGWRALNHLGVASKLRGDSILIEGSKDIWLNSNRQRDAPLSVGETRCIKRSNLIQGLAEDLPDGTVRCGCHIDSIKTDPLTSSPILHLADGRAIKAKVLIGCDGANSVVAQYLKLKPRKVFPKSGVRGLTNYPNGHGLSPEMIRVYKDDMVFGRSPINKNEVFWFLLLPGHPPNTMDFKDQELVRQMCVEHIKGKFPNDIVRMVQECDTSYLFLTYLTYRTPWNMLVERFREGTVTVAGDAMHIMGPFLGQGSSVALEDGVVLGRCLASKIHDQADFQGNQNSIRRKVGEAMDAFVRERRMRLVGLSTQTYLTGLLMATLPKPVKLFIVLLMVIFFHDSVHHTRYDCGPPQQF
ncbi:hypothetical protein FNV43_RR19218 [Rhamnella rubrinervis]|uniref:FAD-binding domain-containing protein n=1 Tax=Rhamnella rubrinervis TaxID=2594499 RepID=A0A8K0EC10_9ROSA|nr:hypothetical protein FNV43_RR19218 [Rhamnella rubrinervis]